MFYFHIHITSILSLIIYQYARLLRGSVEALLTSASKAEWKSQASQELINSSTHFSNLLRKLVGRSKTNNYIVIRVILGCGESEKYQGIT